MISLYTAYECSSLNFHTFETRLIVKLTFIFSITEQKR